MEVTQQDTAREAGRDPVLPSGTEVGEYVIEALIGRGGFGNVYRAVHPVIGKQVAIKVLSLRYSADPAIVSRFHAEARAVNQIGHPNIIDIFSFGQLADGRHCYVMELLDGEPLDRVIAARGGLPLARALPILRALARALDAAHAKGIAHRDLKPENVFLARDADGTRYPKLLDFGIAKLLAPDGDVRHHTGTGVPLGTPTYMSPEQCRGRDVDHRTDIYSFGILTYRLLTGELPFTGDVMELMTAQIADEPAPPSSHVPTLPASIDDAVAWMMRKDPRDRPPTLVAAVAALDPDEPVAIPPARTSRPSVPPVTAPRASRPSAAPPPRASSAALAETIVPGAPPRSRRGRYAALAALVIVGGIGSAIWLVRGEGDLPRQTAGVPPPVPAPVAAPAPAPVAAPAPPPAAPAVIPDAAPPPVPAPPPKKLVRPKREPDAPRDKGDMIHLPHDRFTRGS